MIKLIGDNPFQGVSHLSAERAVLRGVNLENPQYCAGLVLKAIENGADGFMVGVNDKSFPILKRIAVRKRIVLYPLIPDVMMFVRNGNGTVGIAKNVARDMLLSSDFGGIFNGITGAVTLNRERIFKSYLSYEVSRLNLISGGEIASLLFHELITDMALALNLEWIFRTHIEYCRKIGIKGGFVTRNFSYLLNKCREWGISLKDVVIAAPFNSVGFQMCPSREKNEGDLLHTDATVIAFSILAAGYVKLDEAVSYIKKLSIAGVSVGASNEKQVLDTFSRLQELG